MHDLSRFQKKDHIEIRTKYISLLLFGSVALVGLVFALGVLVGGRNAPVEKCDSHDPLAALDGVALGLRTGNFEATARIKLAHFELNDFFPFGAFGSDNGDRERLVPMAVERAEAHLGRSIGLGPHVVVIGDTPRDVECALVHGATAIGVAASRYSTDDLEAAGAHAVLPSLEDIPAFINAAYIQSFELRVLS